MIRVLIVDDEPIACKRLRRLLAADADVSVSGVCTDGPAAVAAIRDLSPDLVFLDIQMPGLDGLEVVRRAGDEPPLFVFVTAFADYALEAFRIEAVDYLLKPVAAERLQSALAMVRLRLRQALRAAGRAAAEPPAGAPAAEPHRAGRLVVKTDGRVVLLNVADLEWIEAAGNYVCLHVSGQTHIIRETLQRMIAMLDPGRFVRIHRGTIVNVGRIRELRSQRHGDYRLLLTDGTELLVSRRFREGLFVHLGVSE